MQWQGFELRRAQRITTQDLWVAAVRTESRRGVAGYTTSFPSAGV